MAVWSASSRHFGGFMWNRGFTMLHPQEPAPTLPPPPPPPPLAPVMPLYVNRPLFTDADIERAEVQEQAA